METTKATKARMSDELIAVGVAHGLTDTAVGELAGVDARTVRRRRSDPAVVAKVESLVAERVGEIHGQLGGLGLVALGVLEDAMDPGEELKHRLAGANATLRNLHSFRTAAEMEKRLAELEQIVDRLAPLLDEVDPR